jgi:adenosyl cobinamide kinase/adenosyl cobinamide phosphate guanylyltransferase
MSKFDDKTLRVLFYGPVNSGKSNFIDSVMSSLIGRIAFKATGGYVAEETRTASKTEKVT